MKEIHTQGHHFEKLQNSTMGQRSHKLQKNTSHKKNEESEQNQSLKKNTGSQGRGKKKQAFKNPRENYFQTRILYSVKFSIKHEGRDKKIFPDMQGINTLTSLILFEETTRICSPKTWESPIKRKPQESKEQEIHNEREVEGVPG